MGEIIYPYRIPVKTILDDFLFSDRHLLKEITSMEEVQINSEGLTVPNLDDPIEKNYGDPINEYSTNSMGYRSMEFKSVDLLISGCSVTFGVGVSRADSWPSLLAEDLGMEYVNLAATGISAQAIVDNLFKYIYKYGNPKHIFVVFPDYNRLILTSHNRHIVTGTHSDEDPTIRVDNVRLEYTSSQDKPKYSKKPHNLVDLIPPEYGLLQAFKAINSLISYCKASNINLIWSTWDFALDKIIRIVEQNWNSSAYSNYVSLDFDLGPECHPELEKINKENFHFGLDNSFSKDRPRHPGTHFHAHCKEKMLEGYRSISR